MGEKGGKAYLLLNGRLWRKAAVRIMVDLERIARGAG